MKKTIYSCPECGSEDVQAKYWVRPNTMVVVESADDEEGWCEKCKEYTSLNIKSVDVENELITKFKNAQENKYNPKYQDNIRYMEELDKMGKLDDSNLRTCWHCGAPMIGGYCLDVEFACSEECAIALYDGDKERLVEDLSHPSSASETYWTQWDEVFLDIELVERYIKL